VGEGGDVWGGVEVTGKKKIGGRCPRKPRKGRWGGGHGGKTYAVRSHGSKKQTLGKKDGRGRKRRQGEKWEKNSPEFLDWEKTKTVECQNDHKRVGHWLFDAKASRTRKGGQKSVRWTEQVQKKPG